MRWFLIASQNTMLDLIQVEVYAADVIVERLGRVLLNVVLNL